MTRALAHRLRHYAAWTDRAPTDPALWAASAIWRAGVTMHAPPVAVGVVMMGAYLAVGVAAAVDLRPKGAAARWAARCLTTR